MNRITLNIFSTMKHTSNMAYGMTSSGAMKNHFCNNDDIEDEVSNGNNDCKDNGDNCDDFHSESNYLSCNNVLLGNELLPR